MPYLGYPGRSQQDVVSGHPCMTIYIFMTKQLSMNALTESSLQQKFRPQKVSIHVWHLYSE